MDRSHLGFGEAVSLLTNEEVGHVITDGRGKIGFFSFVFQMGSMPMAEECRAMLTAEFKKHDRSPRLVVWYSSPPPKNYRQIKLKALVKYLLEEKEDVFLMVCKDEDRQTVGARFYDLSMLRAEAMRIRGTS